MDNLDLLEKKAVNAAINFHWDEAISLNKTILIQDKKNLPALLRLGFAYMQKQKYADAKKIYNRIRRLQPMNQIAEQNLEKINILRQHNIKKPENKIVLFNPDIFLDVLGKTKTVRLVNLGQKNILAQLLIGEKVLLLPKKRRIEIRTANHEYIGCLPDDLSKRLILFIRAKSQYSAYIKEANLNYVVVFIREEKKGKKLANYVSFPVDLQKNINNLDNEINQVKSPEEDEAESEEIDPSELDLEKIAESIGADEKDILPIAVDEPEEENEE